MKAMLWKTIGKRRLILILQVVTLLISILTLTGCQLAQEASNDLMNEDQLCGLFVTIGDTVFPREELNPKDFKINFDAKGNVDAQILGPMESVKVEGKLSDDGSTITFGDMDGYFMGLLIDTVDGEGYTINMADEGFDDLKSSVNATDEGTSHTYEATLTMVAGNREIYHVNPVYQRSDGTFYVTEGNSISFDQSIAGNMGSISLSTKSEETMGERSNKKEATYIVKFAFADPVVEVLVKEMNEKDEMIKVTQYHPEDPEKFLVDRETKYVIVEEKLLSNTEEEYTNRSIYSLDKDRNQHETIFHKCLFADDHGVAGGKRIVFE